MRSIYVVGAGIAGLALLAGCAASEPEVVSYHGDYPVYSSVDDLCGESQLVALVTPVSSEVREVDLSAPAGDTPEENPSLGTKNEQAEVPAMIVVETVTTVRIDTVYKGDAKEGDLIEVGQPGGLLNGVRYTAERFSLKKGDDALMFLNVWDNGVPASPLNPTQGTYSVDEAGAVVAAPANEALKISAFSVEDAICG